MKIFLFLIIFLILGCSKSSVDKKIDTNFDYNEYMSFENFKSKVEIYAENKSYPNLDK